MCGAGIKKKRVVLKCAIFAPYVGGALVLSIVASVGVLSVCLSSFTGCSLIKELNCIIGI